MSGITVNTMESSIIVKNLPDGVYVPELCDIFRCFGNIVSATVHTYENESSEAYIAFENTFSALQAVKHKDNFILRKKKLKVLMSSENERFTKVFVKNINPSWDECDLIRAFEDIGEIENAVISEDKGKSNGYGFIIFKRHSAAKKAVDIKNGVKINGQTLIVERFKRKSERESLKQNSMDQVEEMLLNSIQLNNLHVKNLPSSMTEDEFKRLFSKFGTISSVRIMTDEKGISKGFGFVCFTDDEDAAKALARMNGYLFKGKKLQVSFKEDGYLRKQFTSLKSKAREVKIQQYKQRSRSVPKLLPRPLIYKFQPSI